MKTINQKEIPKVPPERPVPAPAKPPLIIPETPHTLPEILPNPDIPTTKPLPKENPKNKGAFFK
ncbi:MAG: hypothetical protein NTV09_09640 [Bacteroidetes bacterium]|nr:hypothetical protein [Bacteroidota bacterium]